MYSSDIYLNATGLATGAESFSIMDSGMNMFGSVLGIIMGLVVLIDVLSYNMKTSIDRSTDWYYKNKELDKQKDSREDSNNYRIY